MSRRKWMTAPCIALIVCALIGITLMSSVYYTEGKHYEIGPADVIVVLGARVMPDGELSTTLLHRIEDAFAAYEKGYADKFIVCGARGSDEPQSEAEAMKAYLLGRGVPETAIFAEDQSTSTEENIQNAMRIMAENGMRKAILVTSNYHLTRALWLAGDAGLDAYGYPARGPLMWHNRMIARAKESLSWIKYAANRIAARR